MNDFCKKGNGKDFTKCSKLSRSTSGKQREKMFPTFAVGGAQMFHLSKNLHERSAIIYIRDQNQTLRTLRTLRTLSNKKEGRFRLYHLMKLSSQSRQITILFDICTKILFLEVVDCMMIFA